MFSLRCLKTFITNNNNNKQKFQDAQLTTYRHKCSRDDEETDPVNYYKQFEVFSVNATVICPNTSTAMPVATYHTGIQPRTQSREHIITSCLHTASLDLLLFKRH